MKERFNPSHKSYPQKLNEIMQGILSRVTKDLPSSQNILSELWQRAAGDKIASHSQLIRIQKGKLLIYVENSTWMNELTYLKEQIRMQCHKVFYDNHIPFDDLIFKIGNIKKPTEPLSDVSPPGK